MGRPGGEREHSPFEELKDLRYDWSTENEVRGETETGGVDIGEAGSPHGTGAYQMDLPPLARARVHC